MINITENHIKGARNLLINCAELKSGDKLLIVSEQSDLGWYDGHSAEFIAIEAEKMGINQTLTKVGSPKNFRSTDLIELIEKNTVTIFFSRIGDQERFSQPKDGTRIVMCYIRDMDMLSSPFGTTNYNILCDTFNESNEKLLMIKGVFDKFYEATGERIYFNSYLRLELMKRFPEQINMMRDMGIVAAQLGIETLNYASAKAIGKGIETQDVYDTVKKIRKSMY